MNKLNPSYLHDIFQVKDISYNMRDSSKLTQPKYNTKTHGYRSFKYLGAKLWNELPTQVKSAVSINEFKTLIKTWVGAKCKCEGCKFV